MTSDGGPGRDLPLAGVRILDLSDGVAGAYAARIMAGWGADVIKVEPPGGDPTRRTGPGAGSNPDASILFAYLNTGKRSLVLDTGEAGDLSRLRELIDGADLVIESGAPGAWTALGIDLDAARGRHPNLVVCSITPYGQDGPRSHWRANALTAFASGGQMMLCGDPDRPPLKTAGFQAEYQGGLHAFSASMSALLAVRRTGVGDHIDLSLQEVQAACLEMAGPVAMVRGTDATRAGNQLRAIWGIYPTADGYIGVAAMARQHAAVYRCIGQPELAEDPDFSNLQVNAEMNPIVEAFIAAWAGERTSAEIFEDAGRHRAPFSLVATPAELLASPALAASGFWHEVEHPVLGTHAMPGLPFAIDDDAGVVTRAPLLGEHTGAFEWKPRTGQVAPPATATRGLFEGLRVLDLSQVWAGPYAARFLADMGADVIHVEGPAFPDAVRGVGRGGDPQAHNKSVYFNEYNRNKRSLVIDLHDERGMAAFKRLVPTADVVLENWSVGVSERLGIGYDDLRALNPGIVFVQMPAYGKTGPEADRVGYGPAIEQMGGLVHLQGYEGGPPHRSGISYGDPNAGVVAAGATAMALFRRETTGQGGHVVVRQRDNLVGMVGEFMVAAALGIEVPIRTGNRDQAIAPQGVYRCRDDAGRVIGDPVGNPIGEISDTWLALSIQSDEEWRTLVQVIGDPALRDVRFASQAGRMEAHDEIDAAIERWAAAQDVETAAELLQERGLCASSVLSPLMVVRDPHLSARATFTTYDHPVAGVCGAMRPVWRLSERPFEGLRPAPCFGEHNRAVLTEVAGLSAEQVDALEAAGVLADLPLGS